MTTAGKVGIVVWLGLIGALVVLDATAWHALRLRPHWETLAIFAGTLFAGSVAAAAVTCIVDPKRETPTIVQIAGLLIYLIGVLGRDERKRDRNEPVDTSDSSPDSPAWERLGLAWAIFATIMSLGVYAGGLYTTHYLTHRAVVVAAPKKAPAEAPAPPPAPPPPDAPAPRAPDILDAPGLVEAIAIAKPAMTDVRTGPSEGARSLLRYLAAKAKWGDVAVKASETSIPRVEKDASTEHGKRLCAAGALARIEKTTVDGAALYAARLVTAEQDALEVIVVRSTGELVKRSPVKFCGVVTGMLEPGGRPVVFAVGMFDLPANH